MQLADAVQKKFLGAEKQQEMGERMDIGYISPAGAAVQWAFSAVWSPFASVWHGGKTR